MAEYLVTKSFDFVVKSGVVRSFVAGETYSNMTQSAVEKGKRLQALQPVEKDA